MFEASEYELVDFGAGRKLERFNDELLDRPSPAASGTAVRQPVQWDNATARYELKPGGKGRWTSDGVALSRDADASWTVRHGESRLLLKLGASGNVGLFPEQAENWDWIASQVSQFREEVPARRPRILNLFAYTGGATLAAAAAGADVTHVDSSGPTVAWAKRNATASGLADLPVRWLVDDALKFISRELRRGNLYDGVIADPPTYGHGPKGRPFKFKQHFEELIAQCAALLHAPDVADTGRRFLLFSCHAPGFGSDDAVAALSRVLPESDVGPITGGPLVLRTADGRDLAAGVSARWTATS